MVHATFSLGQIRRTLGSRATPAASVLIAAASFFAPSAAVAQSDPHSAMPVPRVARSFDLGALDLGGAARVPQTPDAYRRPYDQYLGGWREPPPPIQSAYVPAQVAAAPAVSSWAVNQPLPPLQDVQLAAAVPAPAPQPSAPAAQAPLPPAGQPSQPTQLAQAAPAQAQPPQPAAAPPPEDRLRYGAGSKYGISELRFGVLAHNKGPIASTTEAGVQVNMEARFASPEFMKILFEPRPTLGASVNTAGDTSFLYGGLTWGGFVWKGLFVEGFFGMAVHNGWLDSTDRDPHKRLMGSRVVFREALEFGYRFLDVHSVSFMVDHYSNAGWLADRNQGNDDFGLRYGYKF